MGCQTPYQGVNIGIRADGAGQQPSTATTGRCGPGWPAGEQLLSYSCRGPLVPDWYTDWWILHRTFLEAVARREPWTFWDRDRIQVGPKQTVSAGLVGAHPTIDDFNLSVNTWSRPAGTNTALVGIANHINYHPTVQCWAGAFVKQSRGSSLFMPLCVIGKSIVCGRVIERLFPFDI